MVRSIIVLGCFAVLGLAGCTNTPPTVNAGSAGTLLSPLAGQWTGKSEVKGGDVQKALNGLAGGPLTGPCTLTLDAGGTGFLKVADKPERPISWKQEGQKVIIETRRVDSSDISTAGGPWVGTLSDENRHLSIDMDDVTVKLEKSS